MTYNTKNEYTGNGVTTDYAIPFSYDVVSEVTVVRADTGAALPFTFVNPSLLRLSSPSPNGVVFTIARETDVSAAAINWSTGPSIRSTNLNAMTNQFLKVMQEVKDAGAKAADMIAYKLAAAASAAAALVSQNAAASSASAASTSASAASTSASAAASSASAASTSATAAGTQATNAAASASAASTSASTAGTQATAAGSSASAASTSASAAASSASAAATSATSASGSATSASTSSTNATNKLTQFTNIYYGPLASNPTTRPDSSALVAGDLYYSTTSLVMMAYNGTAWAAVASGGGGDLYAANNLSDVANAATARSNLGAFASAGGDITGNVGIKSSAIAGAALYVREATGTKTNVVISSTLSGTPRHLQAGSDGDVGAHFGLRGSNGLAFADAGDLIPITIDSTGYTSAVTNTVPLGRLAFRFHSFYCNRFYVTSAGAVFETVAPTFEALTGYMKANGLSAATASSTIPTSDLSGTISAGQLASGAAVSNIGFTPLNAASNLSDVASALTARGNLGAASVQALAAAGIQINGDMEVSQWAGTGLLSALNGYALDGWQVSNNGSLVVSAQQVTDAPTGYNNSLKVSVTTAQTSIGSGDYLFIHQLAEGVRCRKLGFGAAGANYLSVGFWFKSTQIGIYGVSVRNGAGNRSHVQNISYGTANVWQRFTLEFAGDTTGTWATDTSAGLDLGITLACGSTLQGTAGAWAASGIIGTSSQTNGAYYNTNTFQVTGVQLIAGRGLPSDTDAPICRRSFDEELRVCKRYYEKSYNYADLPAAVTASPYSQITDATQSYPSISCHFEVEKRVAPTVTTYSPNNGASGNLYDYAGAANRATSTADVTAKGFLAYVNAVSIAAQAHIAVHWTASSIL